MRSHLAAVLRDDPSRWQAVTFATSILDNHPFPLLVGAPVDGTTASALNSDGSLLATGDVAGKVRVRQVNSGQPIGAEIELGAPVTSLFFDSESQRIAVSADGVPSAIFDLDSGIKTSPLGAGELRVAELGDTLTLLDDKTATSFSWDGETKAVAEFQHKPRGWSLNADGSRLATWSGKAIDGWDMATGTRLFYRELDERILKGSVSGDGSRVALTVGSDHYELLDLATGATITKHSVADQSISAGNLEHLALDTTGTRAVATFLNATSRVFDAETFHPISVPMLHDYKLNVAKVSADRTRMLLAGYQRRIRLWDLTDASYLCEPLLTDSQVDALGFAAKSPHLLLQSAGHTSVWSPSRSAPPKTFVAPGERYFEACHVSDDGRWVFIGTWEGSKRSVVFDQESGEQRYEFKLKGPVYAHLYDPPSQRYISSSASGHLDCWSLTDGSHLWGPVKTEKIHPALLTPDGALVIAGCTSGMIRIFDATDGQLLRELDHGSYPRSLHLFPDARTLISAADDGTVTTWDIQTGTELLRFKAHTGAIIASSISPDGKKIATASYDRSARIWDAATGEPITPPLSHLDELAHIIFSPDGTRVATAARDGKARIWNGTDGRPLTSWMSHPTAAMTTAFSPDGRRLVVTCHDGFRIWDGHTGEPVSAMYPSPIDSGIAIDSPTLRDILSPDGTKVRLGVNASAVTIWDITPPPDICPAWFPDFLEAVARLQLQPDGTLSLIRAEAQLEMREKLKTLTGWHADWAREFLGERDFSEESSE